MASSAAEEFALCQPAYIKKEEEPLSDTEKSISCALWGVFNATEYGSVITSQKKKKVINTHMIQDERLRYN